MKTPESEALGSICDYLALRRHFFFRVNQIPAVFHKDGKMQFRKMPKYSMKGVPDIILIKDGYFVGIEVKAKKGRQSPEQEEFEALSKGAGAEYYVVRSIDDLREIGL